MKVIGFINPRAGVGKTTLVFNLGWTYAEAGFRVLMADLDPQGDLTEVAGAAAEGPTIYDSLMPMIDGESETVEAHPHRIAERLSLLRGDPRLFHVEDRFAQAWLEDPTTEDHAGRRILKCTRDLLHAAVDDVGAEFVLCDLGSNLGSLTHSVAWACDGLIVPLLVGSDPRSFAESREIAVTLGRWRGPDDEALELLGYVAVRASQRPLPTAEDFLLLGEARAYPSLYSMARKVHKPVFSLSSADGAIGSHHYAVRDVEVEYRDIASRIAIVGGLVDDADFYSAVAEAIGEAHAEDEFRFELPFSAYVDGLRVTRIDGVSLMRGGIRVRGSGRLEVDAIVEVDGGEETESRELAFEFDLELDRDRSLHVIHELRITGLDSESPPVSPATGVA